MSGDTYCLENNDIHENKNCFNDSLYVIFICIFAGKSARL